MAESEQGDPHRGNSNADNDYLQRPACTVLEVLADRFSHGRQCYRWSPSNGDCRLSTRGSLSPCSIAVAEGAESGQFIRYVARDRLPP
jgi:hypothetical protein